MPDDYVIANGKTHSVRDFVRIAFECVGINLIWKNTGVDEVGLDAASGKILVRVDPKYHRPLEVQVLKGDPEKARKELGWTAATQLQELVQIMVDYDLKNDGYGGDSVVF